MSTIYYIKRFLDAVFFASIASFIQFLDEALDKNALFEPRYYLWMLAYVAIGMLAFNLTNELRRLGNISIKELIQKW